MLWRRAWAVKSRPLVLLLVIEAIMEGREEIYRFSHTRPSVAVCFFSFSSLRTRSWRVSERAGAAS
jgi:hypothetical protein